MLLFFWDGPFDAEKYQQMNLSESRFLLTNNFFLPDADVNAHKSWKISNRCATFSETKTRLFELEDNIKLWLLDADDCKYKYFN